MGGGVIIVEIDMQRFDSYHITFDSDVVADGEELKITGSIKRTGFVTDIPDYVQVDLVAGNGELIDQQKVSYYPTGLTGLRGHRQARFSARFNTVPPRGATVRLSNVD